MYDVLNLYIIENIYGNMQLKASKPQFVIFFFLRCSLYRGQEHGLSEGRLPGFEHWLLL